MVRRLAAGVVLEPIQREILSRAGPGVVRAAEQEQQHGTTRTTTTHGVVVASPTESHTQGLAYVVPGSLSL